MSDRIILERLAALMLDKLFRCLDTGMYQICDRDKNRKFLANNGLLLEDQLIILRSLTPADCIKEERDRDDPDGKDIYWFYKTRYEGIPVYAKYKIILIELPDGGRDFALIKSLHEDGY